MTDTLEKSRTAAELAAALGVRTGDTLPPPVKKQPRPEDDHASTRVRWSETKRLAFSTLSPAALVIVGTEGPVSADVWGPGGTRGEVERIGSNRPVWPARVATTGSWADTVTTTYNRSPLFWCGTLLRFWFPAKRFRDAAVTAVGDLLARRAADEDSSARLLNGFVNMGPDTDLALLEMEIAAAVEPLGAPAMWDDSGLSRFLDRTVERAVAMQAQGRGFRNITDAIDAAAASEMAMA